MSMIKLILLATTAVTSISAFTSQLPPTRQVLGWTRNSPFKSTEKTEVDIDGIEDTLDSRRSAIEKSGKALAALLLSSSALSTVNPSIAKAENNVAPSNPKVIVVTGCNSGIGFDAAQRMAERGNTIIMACRTLSKANDAIVKMESTSTKSLNLVPKECNLADLDSVRAFAKDLEKDEIKVDALCLNAGIARSTSAKDVARTTQGCELTVGTNHFGHFLLANLMVPRMSSGSTIVVTASGVHDPESPGGAQGSKATLGDLAGLEMAVKNGSQKFDMVDGNPFDPDKAYKDSKLCNVLFTRELQKRLDAANTGITTNCFNPGLIVSTGLFRDQNPIFTKIFDFAATDLLKVGENTHWGGGALEYMTLDKNVIATGGKYFTSPPGSSKYGEKAFGDAFCVSDVSKEAMDMAKGKKLWELSEIIVGLKV